MEEIMIFAGSSGRNFAEKMCSYLNTPLQPSETTRFSEGNTYVKIGAHVRDEEVYLVQPIGPRANDDFVELLFWMDAFRRSGAKYITAVMPYFSYAKGDKKDEPRVSIRARVVAECLELAGADRIITMDLHTPQIQGFFKKPVDHLYARPLLVSCVRKLGLENLVIVAPDAGSVKNARKFSADLGLPLVIADKVRRYNDERSEILDIVGSVGGKNALIVDDFSITGGTLTGLAGELRRKGAERIFACLSHLPLNRQGVRNIEESEIECVISTDSVPNENIGESRKFRIVSMAPVFAEVVRRMQNREPIGDILENLPDCVLDSL